MDLLKSIFKGDKVVWMIFLVLCLISVTEVFSAASTLTYKSGDHWAPIKQHGIILMVGVIVVVIMHNIPYRWFQVFPLFLLPVSAAMLVAVMMMERINGAARWFEFMGLQFQPSEIAKMAVIIVTAYILSRGQTEKGADPKSFRWIMIIAGIICLLIAPENLSTAVLLFGVVLLMMFIGRVPIHKLLILVGGIAAVAVVGITFLLLTKNSDVPFLHRFDTWRARIERFTDNREIPAAKFDVDKNAQIAHARIAVATSNVVGKGPGNSVQRDFLSQAFSDFIFAIIIEELGLIGGVIVVFLYLWLLMRVGRIAKKCDRTFPAFLVIGIALLLVSQAVFNMMVAVGLAPVTGQPLPLISKGGTSTLINCVYIGMILSVSRYTARLDAQHEHDAQIKMEVYEGVPDEIVGDIEAQTAAEPTSEMLNNDTKFE